MIDVHSDPRSTDQPRANLGCASQGPNAASPALVAPLAALLDPAFLNRGETVILALKPSFWFIPLSAGPMLSTIAIAVAVLLHVTLSIARRRFEIELAVVGAGLRITWSILLWMGRLYLLTDLRIMRLGGVFTTDVVSCPLRKVTGVQLVPTNPERLAAVGSIEILPRDPNHSPVYWQTIAQPGPVQQEIMAAVSRATQSGCSS